LRRRSHIRRIFAQALIRTSVRVTAANPGKVLPPSPIWRAAESARPAPVVAPEPEVRTTSRVFVLVARGEVSANVRALYRRGLSDRPRPGRRAPSLRPAQGRPARDRDRRRRESVAGGPQERRQSVQPARHGAARRQGRHDPRRRVGASKRADPLGPPFIISEGIDHG